MDTQNQTVDVSHYTFRVTWSAEDDEFVATCLEFPSLSWLASSRNEAIEGLEQLVADVVDDMAANDEKIPDPLRNAGSPELQRPHRRTPSPGSRHARRRTTHEPQPVRGQEASRR